MCYLVLFFNFLIKCILVFVIKVILSYFKAKEPSPLFMQVFDFFK